MRLIFVLALLGLQFTTSGVFGQSNTTKSFDEAKEKDAIVSVIEMETACYWKRDYDCWRNTYSKKQVLWFVYWGELYEYNSFEKLDADTKNQFESAKEKNEDLVMPKVVRENYNYYFMEPHIAMVWFDQYNTDKDGKCTTSRESRVMEKEDGQWRIVLMNALFIPSKPCDQK